MIYVEIFIAKFPDFKLISRVDLTKKTNEVRQWFITALILEVKYSVNDVT